MLGVGSRLVLRQDEVIRAVAGDREPRRKRLGAASTFFVLPAGTGSGDGGGDRVFPQAEGEFVHSSGRRFMLSLASLAFLSLESFLELL